MDPTKHHTNLENNQVRDLIANGLSEPEVSYGFYGQPDYRGILEKAVETAQRRLEAFDKGRGLRAIISTFGWETFDPEGSDKWDRTMYNPKTYRQFVGTKEEFDSVYSNEQDTERCNYCTCVCGNPLVFMDGKDCPCPEAHDLGCEPLACCECGTIHREYTREELENLPYERLKELATDSRTGNKPQLILYLMNKQVERKLSLPEILGRETSSLSQ